MTEDFLNVTDATFEEEVLRSKLPVLVDFWALWCAPCHMVVPTLDFLAQEYKDKIKIVKFNVDEDLKTPSMYGIRSIPTLLLFMEGEIKETIIGALPQDKILEILSKYL